MSATGVTADSPIEGVLRLLLDRPERRNAIDRAVVETLLGYFRQPDCAAVVLGSTDPTAFCSGADVSIDEGERAEVSELLYELYRAMVTSRATVVAAIGGFAVGGGAQLALASDVRVAGPGAVFRLAGAGHGLGGWMLGSSVAGRPREDIRPLLDDA